MCVLDVNSRASRVLLIGSLPTETLPQREGFDMVAAEASPLVSYPPDGEPSVHDSVFRTEIDGGRGLDALTRYRRNHTGMPI